MDAYLGTSVIMVLVQDSHKVAVMKACVQQCFSPVPSRLKHLLPATCAATAATTTTTTAATTTAAAAAATTTATPDPPPPPPRIGSTQLLRPSGLEQAHAAASLLGEAGGFSKQGNNP